MRARDIVGRRIVRVEHVRSRFRESPAEYDTVCTRIVLDNGWSIVGVAFESDWEPYADLKLVKGKRVEVKE